MPTIKITYKYHQYSTCILSKAKRTGFISTRENMILVGEKFKRRYHFKLASSIIINRYFQLLPLLPNPKHADLESWSFFLSKTSQSQSVGFHLSLPICTEKIESFALRSLSASTFTAPDFASALLFQCAHLFLAPHCKQSSGNDVNNEAPSFKTNKSEPNLSSFTCDVSTHQRV